MNKLFLLGAAGMILGSAGVALAAEDSGKIKTIDQATMTLTLEDGKSFTLPWKEGDMVKIVASGTPEEGPVIKSIALAGKDDKAAASGEAVGTIADIDADKGTLALSSGQTFRMAWAIGDQLTVTYEDNGQDGHPTVSAVETVD